MITTSIKRILKRISSNKIQAKLASGKIVYFESPVEELAFRYVPGGLGIPGKYYAKYYGQYEYEIDSDSTSIIMAVMEGNLISKTRYNNFHLIKSVVWNRKLKTRHLTGSAIS
jgi:acyl CoA:acetate/3-ketoacid CoA transferase alpha subunit